MGRCPHSGMPCPPWARHAQDKYRVGGDFQVGIVDPIDEIVHVFEDHGRSTVLEEVG